MKQRETEMNTEATEKRTMISHTKKKKKVISYTKSWTLLTKLCILKQPPHLNEHFQILKKVSSRA